MFDNGWRPAEGGDRFCIYFPSVQPQSGGWGALCSVSGYRCGSSDWILPLDRQILRLIFLARSRLGIIVGQVVALIQFAQLFLLLFFLAG